MTTTTTYYLSFLRDIMDNSLNFPQVFLSASVEVQVKEVISYSLQYLLNLHGFKFNNLRYLPQDIGLELKLLQVKEFKAYSLHVFLNLQDIIHTYYYSYIYYTENVILVKEHINLLAALYAYR